MKLSTMAIAALLGCGGGSHHHDVDAALDTPIDTPDPTTTLTINTYRAAGPVNTQLVAVQDGDGAWSAVMGINGVYTAKLHSDRYGVMVACATAMAGGGPSIYYGTISDGTNLYFSDCQDPTSTATANISGTITGAAAANPTRVNDAYFVFVDLPAGTTTYTLSTTPGPERLIAEELVGNRPVKLAVADITAVDGGTQNFDLAAGFVPVTKSLSSNGGTIGNASLSYRDVHGIERLDRVTAPFNNYRAIPADKLGSGLNRLLVGNADGTGSSVIRYFKAPTDQTITFPPAITLSQQPTATKVPYPNVQFTVPVRSELSHYDLSFSTTNQTTMIGHYWFAEMTGAYVAKAFPGVTSFAYTMPDFRALAGWQAGFQAEAGLPLDWSLSFDKSTNIDWYPTVPPGTMFDHDGGELSLPASPSGQLPAP